MAEWPYLGWLMGTSRQAKSRGQPPSAGTPRKCANDLALKSRLARVDQIVHPCRDKSIRIAVMSTVKDILGLAV